MTARSPRPRTGGQGGAEPRARIQQREADAWALDLRGFTQREIADELGISQPAVSKILRRVADRYAQQLLTDALRVRARGHATLRFLYRECLAGWERSARDHTRQRQRIEGRRTPAGAHGPAPVEVTVERRAGDPRFLREAREVTVASLQLASAIAGTMPTPPSRTLDLTALSPDELAVVERLVARQQAAMAAGPTPPVPGTAPGETPGEGS